ncbi:MAG: hypothetical protein H6693_06280 [Candidatus Latescibacteria bacterium]|nr:hypothetical protein [Candidatus Latescibacterota bacterium]
MQPNRDQGLLSSVSATQASNVVRAISGVVKVWLLVPFFGRDLYGLWATMSSWLIVIAMIDLGVGAGLQNQISREAEPSRRKALIQGTGLLYLVMVALLALCYLAIRERVLGWGVSHLSLSALSRGYFRSSCDLLVALAISQLLVEPLRRSVLGWRQVASFYWAMTGADLAQLGLMAWGVNSGWPIQAFLVVLGLTPVSAAFVAFMLAMKRGIGSGWFRWEGSIGGSLRILAKGIPFGFVRLLGLLNLQSIPTLLLWIISDAAVSEFSIPMRLAAVSVQALYGIGNVYWPRLAAHGNDRDEFARCLGLVLFVGVLGAVALAAALPLVVHLLSHAEVGATYLQSTGFALWMLFAGVGFAFTVRAYAADAFLLVLFAVLCQVVVQLGATLILLHHGSPASLGWSLLIGELAKWPLFAVFLRTTGRESLSAAFAGGFRESLIALGRIRRRMRGGR